VSWAFCLLLAAGCATDVANRYYADRKYPPKPTEEVAILSAAPSRPYDVIADFQSRGDSPESLRRKAAQIGADAVIVSNVGGAVPFANEWADQPTYYSAHIVGTAIRYK
jgi:hypothetical protein